MDKAGSHPREANDQGEKIYKISFGDGNDI